jgi:hypothetical protein
MMRNVIGSRSMEKQDASKKGMISMQRRSKSLVQFGSNTKGFWEDELVVL